MLNIRKKWASRRYPSTYGSLWAILAQEFQRQKIPRTLHLQPDGIGRSPRHSAPNLTTQWKSPCAFEQNIEQWRSPRRLATQCAVNWPS